MFNRLVEYLELNEPGFPKPDAKRFFQSVSTTEASRIFDVLLTRLKPSFKLNKLEVDVPDALAELDYPYIRSVTRSALVSITTRQAVVNLLIIFNWLVEIIKHLYEVNSKDDGSFFMQKIMGRDKGPSSELDNDLVKKEEECQELYEEINDLEVQADQIDELEAANKALGEDINKCEDYNNEMKKYMNVKNEELCHVEDELKNLEVKMREIERDQEMLCFDQLVKVGLQISPIDIGNLKAQTESVKREYDHERAQCEALISEIRENDIKLERELSKKLTHLDREAEICRLDIVRETELKKVDELEEENHKNLLLDRLRNELEGNRLEAKALIKEKEKEREYFMRVDEGMLCNSKVIKDGLKILRDRQVI